jgi:hypothetical protein
LNFRNDGGERGKSSTRILRHFVHDTQSYKAGGGGYEDSKADKGKKEKLAKYLKKNYGFKNQL